MFLVDKVFQNLKFGFLIPSLIKTNSFNCIKIVAFSFIIWYQFLLLKINFKNIKYKNLQLLTSKRGYCCIWRMSSSRTYKFDFHVSKLLWHWNPKAFLVNMRTMLLEPCFMLDKQRWKVRIAHYNPIPWVLKLPEQTEYCRVVAIHSSKIGGIIHSFPIHIDITVNSFRI